MDFLKAPFISHQSDLCQFPFQSHSSAALLSFVVRIITADTRRPAVGAFFHARSKRFGGAAAPTAICNSLCAFRYQTCAGS